MNVVNDNDYEEQLFMQPGLLGLMEGSISMLVLLVAAVELPQSSLFRPVCGHGSCHGRGYQLGLAKALSDDGTVTNRGTPLLRGVITGVATPLGGMLHTIPFLLTNLTLAPNISYSVVTLELLAIAYIRYRFMRSSLVSTIMQFIVGAVSPLPSASASVNSAQGRKGLLST